MHGLGKVGNGSDLDLINHHPSEHEVRNRAAGSAFALLRERDADQREKPLHGCGACWATQILLGHAREVRKFGGIFLPPLKSIPLSLIFNLGQCEIGLEFVNVWRILLGALGHWGG